MTDDQGASAPNLAELVQQHYAALYRYAFRLSGSHADAEDTLQQAFLAAYRHLDQLRDPGRARSWLFSIVRNVYLKHVRSEQLRAAVSLEEAVAPAAEASPHRQLELDELQQVLNELPEEHRSPIILFYFHEFSYKEIAKHLEVPIGTVMSRLARGKDYLRSRLAAKESPIDRADS